MANKLYGSNFIQFICKNLLKVHARRHPEKRCYVLNENNPRAFGDEKVGEFQKFYELSQMNVRSLHDGGNKFYEYSDFKRMMEEE